MDADDEATRAALLSDTGRALVELLTPYEPDAVLRRMAEIRQDPHWAQQPGVVAAAATQARLRTRAGERFPGPPRWWTPDGLEQATRPAVAALHADRFAAAGCARVADLGCGAGSDTLALAARGISVLAVDRDPTALWALGATARDRGLPVELHQGDVCDLDWWWNAPAGAAASDGCFVDPARRSGGRRQLDPERWSPTWSWTRALAGRVPATGAKVAPGLAHDRIPADAQADWVSVVGELVECGVWWGPLRRGPASRVATVLSRVANPALAAGTASPAAAPLAAATLDDSDGIPVAEVGPVTAWLVEPDPAVIRAGLVSVLAARLGGHLLDPRIGYVLCDAEPRDSSLGTAYEVVEEVPFARKQLRARLRARGFRDVIVKKRGVNVVPEELRQALRLGGGGPTATLVLTRTDAGPLALLVRPRQGGALRTSG